MNDSDTHNARQSFLSNLRNYFQNKSLHGLYMMGHGGEEKLNSENPTKVNLRPSEVLDQDRSLLAHNALYLMSIHVQFRIL